MQWRREFLAYRDSRRLCKLKTLDQRRAAEEMLAKEVAAIEEVAQQESGIINQTFKYRDASCQQQPDVLGCGETGLQVPQVYPMNSDSWHELELRRKRVLGVEETWEGLQPAKRQRHGHPVQQ